MKILIIQPWLSYRGAESISLDEAHGLRSLGHEVAILCLYVDRSRLREEDLSLNFILPYPVLRRFCQRSNIFFFIFGFFILLVLFLLKGRSFDIYNPHNFPGPWAAVIAALFYKKPVFWTVHNFPQHGFTNPWVSRLWESLIHRTDQFLVSRITGIICVSEKVKKQVYATYKRRSQVIYPPVDIAFFTRGKTKGQKGLDISPAKHLVLIPSKLHQVKNILVALKAISLFLKQEKDVVFVFAGEGSMLPKLKSYVKDHELEPYVRFAGFIPKERLRGLYKSADFIFLPGSYGEGFNIVVLEGLCLGTPSIVIKNSGVDKWISERGIGFVVEGEEKKIADLFNTLIKNRKKLIAVGNRGKQEVKKYSPRAYAGQLVEQFNHFAKSK